MQKLQQAMDEEADYHDPPPPPPHLMALTQGFKVTTRNFFIRHSCYVVFDMHAYTCVYVYNIKF